MIVTALEQEKYENSTDDNLKIERTKYEYCYDETSTSANLSREPPSAIFETNTSIFFPNTSSASLRGGGGAWSHFPIECQGPPAFSIYLLLVTGRKVRPSTNCIGSILLRHHQEKCSISCKNTSNKGIVTRSFSSSSSQPTQPYPPLHVSLHRSTRHHNNNSAIQDMNNDDTPDGCCTNKNVVPSENKSPFKSMLKSLVKRYGSLVWKTYWAVYFGTLASFFGFIHWKLLDPLAILGFFTKNDSVGGQQTTAQFAGSVLESYKWLKPYAPMIESSPMRADFVVAWVLAEASEPIRILTTCGLVPSLAGSSSSSRRRASIQ